jgi:hypothetical protein
MGSEMSEPQPTDQPFIFHLRPRMFSPGIDAKLIDLRIDQLGVHLTAGELATGRPYPNKGYKVGRRKIGRKAVDGLLLSLSEWPDFEVRMQWAVAAEYVATHNVTYKLLDKDFRGASDDMTLWYAYGPIDPENYGPEAEFKFRNRFPDWAKDIPPVKAQPQMEAFPTMRSYETDKLGHDGRLLERSETFALPTIEPERFLGSEYPRERIHLPTLEMAITL